MKEVKFESWTVTGDLNYPEDGQHPNFEVTEGKQFTSQGHEKKVEVKKKPLKEGEEAAPEEQSFFQKYWMQILLAMFLLPRLLGGQEEEAPAQGAAAAPAQRS